MDQLSKDVLLRYALPGRPAGYPPVAAFADSFGPRDFLEALRIASLGDGPLSFYIQLPSCRHRAAPCHCAPLARRDRALTFLHGLDVEMALVAEALDGRRSVGRLYLDGGMPGLLDEAGLERLWRALTCQFVLERRCEQTVELLPEVTTEGQLELLRLFGFWRLSLELGAAPGERLVQQVERCRALGYRSLQLDLLYALPGQSPAGLASAIEAALALQPDRIALHNLAELPRQILSQRGFDPAGLPGMPERIELQLLAYERLVASGYRPVGYEHFALPADPLCRSLDRKELYRGFMGYCTTPSPDLIGFGVAAVSEVQGAYVQNAPRLSRYLTSLSHGRLPVERGYRKSAEDELRGEIIERLLCLMEVDLEAVARAHGVIAESFRPEIDALQRLESDGLVQLHGSTVRVTELGRLAVWAVATLFDRDPGRSPRTSGVALPA
jgi:oxygen-independent coproporphyrinogen III oxidase